MLDDIRVGTHLKIVCRYDGKKPAWSGSRQRSNPNQLTSDTGQTERGKGHGQVMGIQAATPNQTKKLAPRRAKKEIQFTNSN